MSSAIIFPTITNDSVPWANLAALQAFFDAAYVAAASPTETGGVLQAATVAAVSGTPAPSYQTLDIVQGDGSTVTVIVPTQADFAQMLTVLTEIKTNLNLLVANLKTSGAVAS